MNFKSGRLFIFTAVAVGFGICALQASAQQAKFHLPFEAHWGTAVLAPGDYNISVPFAEVQPIFHVSGDNKSSMVTPLVAGEQPLSTHSALQVVNVNGVYFVKEYKSGPTGRVFSFPVPKPVVEASMASTGAAIPVDEGTK